MVLVLSSALLLVFSYPPFDLGWVAWGALVPWLVSLERATPRQALLSGYAAGLFFFGGTLAWVGHVTVPGAAILIAYLALYFSAWSGLAHRLLTRKGKELLFCLGLPAGWVGLEYLRASLLGGLGWNLLAHTQWNRIPLIQIADTTGVWGVSFLIVGVNTALYLVVSRGPRRSFPALCWAGVCLLGAFSYGQIRVYSSDSRVRPTSPSSPAPVPFKAAVVQGNIPQPKKWDDAFQEAIWKRYEELTSRAAQDRPDLIIWPETAVPGFLQEPAIRRRMEQIVLSAAVPVLVGVPTEGPEPGCLYNSAVLFGADGRLRQRYDKLHLVPFGEFVPLKPLFGWLNQVVPIGSFSAGHDRTVFQMEPPFSVLICFEDIFPDLSRRFVQAGARWLLVITNDGWFERSAASLQHLQASVFRAVEGRVWIGRASNTGWSGFIDPYGRRLPPPAQLRRFKPGVAEAELQIHPLPSFYVRHGDGFLVVCLGLVGWALFPSRKRL